MTCGFTLAHYKKILLLAKKRGYAFGDFFTRPTLSEKRIYLRHDVEVSLDAALKIAEIEKKENVKSSYFVFINSPSYNIFNDEDQKIIKEIAALGHDIGIHYEWREGQSEKNMVREVLNYYNVLNALSLSMKKIVSFHRPPVKAQGKIFSQFINTYDPHFFGTAKNSETKYISDSNKEWREGCACAFLKHPSDRNLQMLTHPMWWNKEDLSLKDIRNKLADMQRTRTERWLESNIKAYKSL